VSNISSQNYLPENKKLSERRTIMAKGSHHIVPDPDGGWNIKKGGAERASKHFDKKQDAIDAGRNISRNQKTELYIHGKNGRIQKKDSHGNDPYPPPG